MSEIKVNKLTPRTNCGTVTLGDSGDTIAISAGADATLGGAGSTITIPAGATITNSGTASGFGSTGEISWDTTVKTTGTFTATAGIGYFCNTTGGTITVNLPAGSAGSSVALADYAGTWQTSNVTVSPNGTEKMGGVNADITLNTEGQSVAFVYIDGTQGWVNVLDSTSNVRGNPNLAATGGCITTTGDYKIHTFNSPGTFTVTNLSGTPADNTVSYLVVAGGASGAGRYGGGGGAGGFREYRAPVSGCYAVSPLNGNPCGTAVTVTATAYPIVVGGGGAGVPDGNDPGNAGNVSSFSTISSAGGGGGGGQGANGVAGGSGGGGSWNPGSGATGGAGNDPATTPPQGSSGGQGHGPASPYATAGGGGATEAGQNAVPSPPTAGRGGAGATSSITGSPVGRSGGGGGSGEGGHGVTAGAGSPCGSGTAGSASNTPAANAADNRGGGGGGAYFPGPSSLSGNGGSGIVVIRYKYQ